MLEAAAAAVRDAFAAGELPVLTASDCSICIATLPEVVLHEPDLHVAWIDAHGDFNTPDDDAERLPRRHVPGRRLRALGRGPRRHVDPSRVHLLGARDLDPGSSGRPRRRAWARRSPTACRSTCTWTPTC